jgi:hypothetical protein
LSVDDSEIKVAKYMNAKERAELEKVGLGGFRISHAATMICQEFAIVSNIFARDKSYAKYGLKPRTSGAA